MGRVGDDRGLLPAVDVEGLRQLLALPLGIGADQLEVVGARPAAHGEGDQRVGGAGGVGAAGGGGDAGQLMEPVHELLQVGAGDDDVVQQVGDVQDRKSTRLNSSHVAI